MRSEFEIPEIMLPEIMFPDLMRIPFFLQQRFIHQQQLYYYEWLCCKIVHWFIQTNYIRRQTD